MLKPLARTLAEDRPVLSTLVVTRAAYRAKLERISAMREDAHLLSLSLKDGYIAGAEAYRFSCGS